MFSLDIWKCFPTGLCFLWVQKRSHCYNIHDIPPKWELTFSVGMDGHFEVNSRLSQLCKHTCKLLTLYRLFFVHISCMWWGARPMPLSESVYWSMILMLSYTRNVTAREQYIWETLVFRISRQKFSLKHLYLCTVLYGITYQKTAILILNYHENLKFHNLQTAPLSLFLAQRCSCTMKVGVCKSHFHCSEFIV